jgi:two-component system LytT family response regulator
MTRLRAYLVDDEPLALQRLSRLLRQRDDVQVIGQTSEPEEAVAALSNDVPDLCFLDIEMPRLNGFDVLARLPRQPAVIFTTAYDHYALQAFEVNSVDYLLKPIDERQLDRALKKVERLKGLASPEDVRGLLKVLQDSLRQPRPGYLERIASRLGDKLCFIDLEEVTYFVAEDKLTYAVTEGKNYCVDHTISGLESKLDPKRFIRIHRATLLNIAWIKELSSLPGGGLSVRLKDAKNTILTVARDRARDFKQRLSL